MVREGFREIMGIQIIKIPYDQEHEDKVRDATIIFPPNEYTHEQLRDEESGEKVPGCYLTLPNEEM
jgi:hypothetical protein